MAQASIRDVMKKSDLILMAVCVVAAAISLVFAGENVANAGNFLTIDSLFFTSVCLLLALTFVPVLILLLWFVVAAIRDRRREEKENGGST